jgi:hypothetical protein
MRRRVEEIPDVPNWQGISCLKTLILWGRPIVFSASISTDWSLWSIPEANGKVRQHQLLGLSYITPLEGSPAHGLQLCLLWLLICVGW